MTTMISDLPRDLIEDILSRLSWKSMKAVRLTCKSWNNFSKSEMYIGKSTREGQSMMIAMMPHNLYLMSCVVDDVDPSIEHKGQLSFLHNQISISRISHYEGLILCILKDVTRIIVWNPYLGQTRWVNLRFSHCYHFPKGCDMFNYTLGYEVKESCRCVKILRFVDYFYNVAPDNHFFWYEIYDFDSGLWTTLDVTPHWSISCSTQSVSLKGNTYWCAYERSLNGHEHHIICFDFTKERFGPLLPLPSSITDHEYKIVTLSCVKEEKIAALFWHGAPYNTEIEIWITTKIEAEMVSWSKFLRFNTSFFLDRGLKIVFPITFFIDEEKKVFMGVGRENGSVRGDWDYDSGYPKTFINIIGEAGYLKILDLGLHADQKPWRRVCSYVPSLIPIKKLSRVGKNIEQSSLEKQRFDQNSSRLAAIEKLRSGGNLYEAQKGVFRRVRKIELGC